VAVETEADRLAMLDPVEWGELWTATPVTGVPFDFLTIYDDEASDVDVEATPELVSSTPELYARTMDVVALVEGDEVGPQGGPPTHVVMENRPEGRTGFSLLVLLQK